MIALLAIGLNSLSIICLSFRVRALEKKAGK